MIYCPWTVFIAPGRDLLAVYILEDQGAKIVFKWILITFKSSNFSIRTLSYGSSSKLMLGFTRNS